MFGASSYALTPVERSDYVNKERWLLLVVQFPGIEAVSGCRIAVILVLPEAVHAQL